MHVPTALLYFPDRPFGDRLEILLDEIQVISARAATSDEAGQLTKELRPDLLLLDMDGNGRQTGRVMNSVESLLGQLPVIWFATAPTPQAEKRVRKTGAFGLLAKESDPIQIVRAVRTVLRGHAYFPGMNTFPATPGAKGLAESERLLKVLSKVSG